VQFGINKNWTVVLMRPCLKLFFEWLKKNSVPCSSFSSRINSSTSAIALTKMPRNEAKIYPETDFLSTEGYLLTSSGCFLTLTSSLDVVQVRFAFVELFMNYLISKLYSFANVEWLHLSSSNYDMAGS